MQGVVVEEYYIALFYLAEPGFPDTDRFAGIVSGWY